MTNWRYAIEGQAYGPVSDEVIRSLAYQGVLGPMSNVLPEGSASWTPLYVHETMLGLSRNAQGIYSAPEGRGFGSSGARPWTNSPPPPPPPGSPTTIAPRPVPGAAPPPGYATYSGPYAQAVASGIPFASWGRRAAAAIIDAVVVQLPLAILLAALGWQAFRLEEDGPGSSAQWDVNGKGLLISIIVGAAYFGILIGLRGQTVGKMVMHIRVCDLRDGSTIGLGRGLARWAIQLPLALPCGIGTLLDVLWPLWDERKQAIHDKVAGSVVIRS